MADSHGQARALMVLTAVSPGRTERLRRALAGLPTGEESPLARLPGIHFGRWVIVPRPGAVDQLLFSATYDAGPSSYLDDMCRRIPVEADAVWGHCEGYPGAADRNAFVRYMEANRVRTNLFVAAYPDATLAEVREALTMRRRLIDFVPEAQGMAARELQAAFREGRLAG